MTNYTTVQISDYCERLTFNKKNSKGEHLVMDIVYCEDSDLKSSLPKLWKKHGFIDRVLKTYWSVHTYVTDADGNCWGIYNPTVKPNENKINFDYMFEATEENKQALINETYKRFMEAK